MSRLTEPYISVSELCGKSERPRGSSASHVTTTALPPIYIEHCLGIAANQARARRSAPKPCTELRVYLTDNAADREHPQCRQHQEGSQMPPAQLRQDAKHRRCVRPIVKVCKQEERPRLPPRTPGKTRTSTPAPATAHHKNEQRSSGQNSLPSVRGCSCEKYKSKPKIKRRFSKIVVPS